MTDSDYTTLSEQELLEALDEAFTSYMYYEATESRAKWEQEREARNRAEKKYHDISAEVRRRGLRR